MIRVLLVDDQLMFLDGIKSFLENEKEIFVAGTALNGIQALESLANTEVDVVILDIRMPQMDGHEAVKKIKQGFPNVKILAVTGFKEDTDVFKMLSNGADGYILKNKSKEELVSAILKVYKGQRHTSLEIEEIYWNYIQNKSKIKKGDIKLTTKETEVIKLLAMGLQDREIAEKLNIAQTTVFTHTRNLRKKIGVSNRTELSNFARDNGII